MAVPDHLVALVAGEPQDETWEPVFPLLTVDGDGFPRVCLLSRGELRLQRDAVRCVVRARRTRANLDRDPRGLLMIVHGESAYYLRLTVRRALDDERDRGVLAVEFAVDLVEEDTLHVPLRAMNYRATERVRRVERTDDNRELLERLAHMA